MLLARSFFTRGAQCAPSALRAPAHCPGRSDFPKARPFREPVWRIGRRGTEDRGRPCDSPRCPYEPGGEKRQNELTMAEDYSLQKCRHFRAFLLMIKFVANGALFYPYGGLLDPLRWGTQVFLYAATRKSGFSGHMQDISTVLPSTSRRETGKLKHE